MSVKSIFNIDRMIDHLAGFLETRLEILKLDFKEESVRVIAKLITMAVIALFGTLFFIFFSVALGIYLNQVLGSAYLGFVILAVCFLLLFILVLIVKESSWYHNLVIEITDRIVEDSNKKPNDEGPQVTGNSQ